MSTASNSTKKIANGLSRRQFAVCGAAAVAANCAGVAQASTSFAVKQSAVRITTMDGVAQGMFIHPDQGKHPGIVLWPDAAGLRSSGLEIAQRLAERGFSVLIPDPHYRAASGTDRGPAENLALVANVADHHINRDGKSYAAWLGQQDAVSTSRDGYLVRSHLPSLSPLAPRGQGVARQAAYLVLTPRGRDALSDAQMRALDDALHGVHGLAKAQVYSAFAA